MRTLAVFVLLCGTTISGIGGAAAGTLAQADQDRTEVTAAAQQLFHLAASGNYNALYDRIHPDAHAVIPRDVAVRTFEEAYRIAQAKEAQITDVRFLPEWTWPVTGTKYQNAADVRFTQPYVENGQTKTLTDTMYLVKSDGEWRWFFGNSREFVDQRIAKYGDQRAQSTPASSGDLLQFVTSDLDQFYRDSLKSTQFTYVSPGVVLAGQRPVATGCGPAQPGFLAFLCPEDDTVYLDGSFLANLYEQSDFAVAYVIAHEWAHHVQTEVGIERSPAPSEVGEFYSIQIELMADCMAGVWTQDADTRGILSPGDVEEAFNFVLQQLGDPANVSWNDPQAHGTGEQRATSFMSGYKNGFLGCGKTI